MPRLLPKIAQYLRNESTQLQTVAIGALRQLCQRAPRQVSEMCEDEFDRGIEGKLIGLFDVPNGIELNQVKERFINILLMEHIDKHYQIINIFEFIRFL